MKQTLSSELVAAMEAARLAGERILEIRKKDYEIETKEDGSLVTEADYAAHDTITEILSRNHAHNILSEEGDKKTLQNTADSTWVIDPIDGTGNFAHGGDSFSILIGLLRDMKPVMGVVYRPLKKELYFAERSRGAYLIIEDREPIKLEVSELKNRKPRIVQRGSTPKKCCNALEDIFGAEVDKLSGGGAARMISVARGTHDAYISFTPKGSIWDICAPDIILQEAGGVLTTTNGKPFNYSLQNVKLKQGNVAATPEIFEEIMKKIDDAAGACS